MGEGCDRAEFGIVKSACCQNVLGFDGLFDRVFSWLRVWCSLPGKTALVGTGGDDVYDFDFASGQAVGGVELADLFVFANDFGGDFAILLCLLGA